MGDVSGADRAFNSDYNSDHSDTDSIPEGEKVYLEEMKAWCVRLKMSMADLEVFNRFGYDFDKIPRDAANRRDLLAYLKREENGPAKWVLVSGLYPELAFAAPERRKRLRSLYRAVLLYVRRALARQQEEDGQGQGGSPHCNEGQAGRLHHNDGRSIYWDPIAEVCWDLQIAPSKLSALCKEYSGNSLSQVIDCVRAERVKKLMRKKIAAFVSNWKARCATLNQPEQPLTKTPRTQRSHKEDEEKWVVWGELKASRKWPEFCQNTWAVGFGFSTYRRMYRACMAVWRETPHQMEMALIVEFLKEPEKFKDSENDAGCEFVLSEVEKSINDIYFYRPDDRLGLTG